MDKAKAAINDFMSKSGHHDTTVHETVSPAVQHETVKPHQHEEVVTAIDKEVHQDHYHRTVQPVKDREILPEKHTHNLGAVQHREVDHRDHDSTKRALEVEGAQFRNERVVEGTSKSQSVAPTVGGEHVHHHIHETIQPVIDKETIQPNVVHTTVPIHETHHNAAQHHQTSTLPTVSLSDFKSRGGVLGGREERYDGFEGEPKNIGGAVAAGLKNHHRDDSHHTSETRGTGLTGNSHHHDSGLTGKHDSGLTGSHSNTHGTTGGLTGNNHGTTGGLTGSNHGTTGGLTGNNHGTTGGLTDSSHRGIDGVGASTAHSDRDHHHNSNTSGTKPSMMDKLNPKVDANGDGKAGFMK